MTPAREQELLEKIASLTAKVAELSALNEQLLQAVDRLSRRLFGKSSEQLDPNQLELLLGELGRQPAPPPPRTSPRPPVRNAPRSRAATASRPTCPSPS